MQALSLLADPAFLPYAIGLAAAFGACIGSFITLVTYRLPRDEKIGATRSRCPQCSTVLRVMELVPMLSWLAARGKCRHCKAKVSPRYPLTELASAVGAATLVWHFGGTLEAFALCGLWWCIVAIFVTDLEHYIILDEVQIAVGIFGTLSAIARQLSGPAVAIAAVTGLLIGLTLKYGFIYLRKKDGLGMGDVKFLFVAGIWLANAANFVPFLFFSGLMGILSGLVWKALGQGERFPFGPALAMALLLCVVFPPAADGFWQLYGLLGK